MDSLVSFKDVVVSLNPEKIQEYVLEMTYFFFFHIREGVFSFGDAVTAGFNYLTNPEIFDRLKYILSNLDQINPIGLVLESLQSFYPVETRTYSDEANAELRLWIFLFVTVIAVLSLIVFCGQWCSRKEGLSEECGPIGCSAAAAPMMNDQLAKGGSTRVGGSIKKESALFKQYFKHETQRRKDIMNGVVREECDSQFGEKNEGVISKLMSMAAKSGDVDDGDDDEAKMRAFLQETLEAKLRKQGVDPSKVDTDRLLKAAARVQRKVEHGLSRGRKSAVSTAPGFSTAPVVN